MKFLFIVLIIFPGALNAWSQEAALNINLAINEEDGIIHGQNHVQSYVSVENKSKQKVIFTTQWSIFSDTWQLLKMVVITDSVAPQHHLRTYCPLFHFPAPGFYQIQAQVSTATFPGVVYQHNVGVDPEKINEPTDKKADFDVFWKNALKELSEVKPEYALVPIKREDNRKTNLYRVTMKSYHGTTVRGWLEVPKKQGVYPALLRVPGYEDNMQPIDIMDDLIVFSFNPRDHGESDDSEGGRSWDMWVRRLDIKDDYYYKGLFLDCIRALDFISTQSSVDPARIAIWGGSQGGGLSFSTAALDKRIALCIADIPYMCDYPNYFKITHWKELDQWFERHPAATWDTVLNTLSYYDTKNMADKITCPVWMGIGLQDNVCPPATSFATYNRVQTNKQYAVYKHEGHHQPDEHFASRFTQLRKFFNMDAQK